VQKTPTRPLPPPAKAPRRIVLSVRNPNAREVRVTGDFTGWSAEGVPLRKTEDGEFEAAMVLEPGVYQYRLLVDGEWADHPEAARRVANPYGSENCVIEID
jgi:1,4-alpha-glucan branching enzyme